jgi:Do/DeqQ family serine protease
MKQLWLLFSQTVTVLVAAWFVLVTFKPQWVSGANEKVGYSIIEAPATPSSSVAAGSFSAAAKKAVPAVVSISASKKSVSSPVSNDPWFKFFYGEREEEPQAGLGSGVIVSPEGYILTNNHVIEGADDIEVFLSDQRHVHAKVIGADPETDVAVLKINLKNLPVIALGHSEELQVGDQVLAIGNPFGVGQTVTSGIVSALGRSQLGINTFENFIQTDAAINPGNSGGALIDVYGNLVGINTAIYSRSGGSMGIGFAIPVALAKQVMESLVTHGQVIRGWIGVEPLDLTPELARSFGSKLEKGVLIKGVLQSGPAFKAGLQPGDIIIDINGQHISHVGELLSHVAALKPGETVSVKIQRQSETRLLRITPDQRPRPRKHAAYQHD